MFIQKTNKWDSFIQAIDMFSEDFMADGRTDIIGQEREAICVNELKLENWAE